VLVVTAAAAAGIDTLVSGSGSPSPAPPQASRSVESAVATVLPAEARTFGILRRARNAGDDFAAIRAGAGPFGANPALARTALAPTPADSPLAPRLVSVVPAATGVCLRVLEAEGYAQWWCVPSAQAIRGLLIVALLPPSPTPEAATRQFVIGLVPDGVSTVTIRSAGGVGHKLAVQSNVYATAVFRPVSIAFKLPGRGFVSYRIRD